MNGLRVAIMAIALGALCIGRTARAERQFALLIASGRFAPQSNVGPALPGTINDMRLMLALLRFKFLVEPADICIVGASQAELGEGNEHCVYAAPRMTQRDVTRGFEWLT